MSTRCIHRAVRLRYYSYERIWNKFKQRLTKLSGVMFIAYLCLKSPDILKSTNLLAALALPAMLYFLATAYPPSPRLSQNQRVQLTSGFQPRTTANKIITKIFTETTIEWCWWLMYYTMALYLYKFSTTSTAALLLLLFVVENNWCLAR